LLIRAVGSGVDRNLFGALDFEQRLLFPSYLCLLCSPCGGGVAFFARWLADVYGCDDPFPLVLPPPVGGGLFEWILFPLFCIV